MLKTYGQKAIFKSVFYAACGALRKLDLLDLQNMFEEIPEWRVTTGRQKCSPFTSFLKNSHTVSIFYHNYYTIEVI